MRPLAYLTLILLCAAAVGCAGIPKTVPYPVTVNMDGDGGSITSAPAGLSCSGSSCSGNFTSGTTVTLTASAQQGFSFSGWDGACSGAAACTITMNGPQSITAHFTKQPAQFQLQVQ